MALPFLSGIIPTVMTENSGADQWLATLNLIGSLDGIVEAEAVGPDGSYFAISLNAAQATLSITPGARVDYEALMSTAYSNVLTLSIAFRFSDGHLEQSTQNFFIAVTDVDDTPPSNLHFISGGSVEAGTLGSTIGTLLATDPDTAATKLVYAVADTDAWMFRIDGTTLSLQPGASLGLDDVPERDVLITVSDGHQTSAFTLAVTVTAPGDLAPALRDLMVVGESEAGYAYDSTSSVFTLEGLWDVASYDRYYGGITHIETREGQEVWLPSLSVLHFANGWIDTDLYGPAAEATSLYQAVLNRAPDGAGLSTNAGLLQAGMNPLDMAASLLASAEYQSNFGQVDDTTFVTRLYATALGRSPDAAGLAFQLAQLQGGTSRAQMVVDIALSPEALNRVADTHPGGIWVITPYAKEVSMVYQAGLGRVADAAGLADWVGQLASGHLAMTDMAAMIAGSDEFAAQHNGQNNTAFVESMYQNTFGRAADASGLSYWVDHLNTGMSRAELVGDFATSAELLAQFSQLPSGDLFG